MTAPLSNEDSMKSAQFLNRMKLASLVALGLVFPASAQSQTVAHSNNAGAYSNSQVPRGDYRPQSTHRAQPVRVSSGQQTSVHSASRSGARPAFEQEPAVVVGKRHSSNQPVSGVELVSDDVELASCSSCQTGGVSHAYSAPLHHESRHHDSRVAHDGAYFDEGADFSHALPYGRQLGRPGAYQLSGGACGDVCADPAVGLLGSLLVHSQIRVAAATFWGDGQNVLPLVTTSAQNPIDLDTAGTLADPLRRNLFGGEEMLGEGVQGIRGEIGLFTSPCRTGGLMLRLFDAGNNSETYQSLPGTNGFIARPFLDGNSQQSLVINHGNVASGTVSASIESDVYGGDILLRRAFHQERLARFEWLLGYQMMRLDESLSIDSTTNQNGIAARVNDSFATSNRFHGAAIGMNMHLSNNCWSFNTMLKLGIGSNDREVDIHGNTTFSGATSSSTANGLLARQTNSGNYTSSTMVAVPELSMNLGYKVTHRLEAVVGYSFLTLPKSVQAAYQIDPDLRADLTAGGPAPRFNLTETNYSLHSLSYGVQYRY